MNHDAHRPRLATRRRLLKAALGAGVLTAAGAGLTALARPRLLNACLADLPAELIDHPLIAATWSGLDASQVWDCHAHLAGTGDSGRGLMMNPRMLSLSHPVDYVQRLFFLNAGCAHEAPGRVDDSYVERLHNLMEGMAEGFKMMLFAFDYTYAPDGTRLPEHTAFHIPDHYAREIAQALPARFEWVASVHPYRKDAVDALEQAVERGACALKWLPPAMGIDPAAPACKPFYAALARLKLPLITHVGEEKAVHGAARPEWGNPLRLRAALEQGVTVVMAHCASHGEDVDTDQGPSGPRVESFELFARMMGEAGTDGSLYGDISAVILRNRDLATVRTLIERREWHPRLLFGTDYPLPGIVPLIAPATFARAGMLPDDTVEVLEDIRMHNPILFALALKRHLRSGGQGFSGQVFETRRVFDRRQA